MSTPATTRVYVSFDYDHDADLKVLLIGQSRKRDTPFAFEDWSIKRETKGWKADARGRIRRCAVVVVICGLHTQTAIGVAAEIEIAREERVPYSLLRGRREGKCQRPRGTSWFFDEMHDWKWSNIEAMCVRATTPWWRRIW